MDLLRMLVRHNGRSLVSRVRLVKREPQRVRVLLLQGEDREELPGAVSLLARSGKEQEARVLREGSACKGDTPCRASDKVTTGNKSLGAGNRLR